MGGRGLRQRRRQPARLDRRLQTKQIKVGTAIMQMPARTPAMTAMTATTLDQISGGRFLLGSVPRARRWSRAGTASPTASRCSARASTSRSCADLAREEPLEYQGEHYQIPYQGPDATGLGKPLKSILHGRRDPDLRRRDRPQERRADRRDRRRLAADLLLARAR
jgi:alkanesulfonate monooxygenase SsuD/methylene tetrahydromethanopterin reductase-like flavin-dependent oxidoreductase (luciferase family)